MMIFLEIIVVLKWNSFIAQAFACNIRSFTLSLLRAVDSINLLLFSEENILSNERKQIP